MILLPKHRENLAEISVEIGDQIVNLWENVLILMKEIYSGLIFYVKLREMSNNSVDMHYFLYVVTSGGH